MTNLNSPQHHVGLHERGIICGGEVFGRYLGHVNEQNIDEWMMVLTPELLARFVDDAKHTITRDPADYLHATSDDIQRWNHAAELIQAWCQRLKSEQAGTGQPATGPVVEPEGGVKPQPEAEGRSR